jgi:hypothetical protein
VYPRVYGSNRIGQNGLKLAGFFLLVAGWALMIAALVLLPPRIARGVFVCVALAVEIAGLGLLVRSHMRLGDARK